MANRVQEVLGADGMTLPIWCGGMSRVGVRLAGTWVGTAYFEAATDGIQFRTASVTPFASGTGVTSATANGNWFLDVLNYLAFRVRFVRTSGSLVAYLAASGDQSYQDAFLAPNAKFINSVATAATNTLTVAAQTNRAWRLRTLVLSVSATPTWASNPMLTIKDGTTLLWAVDYLAAAAGSGVFTVPLPADPNTPGVSGGGIVNTPGNSLVIACASGGGAVQTNLNAQVEAA